jgi:hypothetical protein
MASRNDVGACVIEAPKSLPCEAAAEAACGPARLDVVSSANWFRLLAVSSARLFVARS